MANAARDENSVPTIIAVLDTDGDSTVRVQVNPTNNGLMVADGIGGADLGPENAIVDENSVPVLMAVSSTDGVTPVPVYADSQGRLLIQTS